MLIVYLLLILLFMYCSVFLFFYIEYRLGILKKLRNKVNKIKNIIKSFLLSFDLIKYKLIRNRITLFYIVSLPYLFLLSLFFEPSYLLFISYFRFFIFIISILFNAHNVGFFFFQNFFYDIFYDHKFRFKVI